MTGRLSGRRLRGWLIAAAALPLAGCVSDGGTAAGSGAGSAAGAQLQTLPRGAGEAEIRRFCTIEAQRQAETIPAIQSGQTTYTGGKDHDFEGCLKRHGM